MPSISLCLCAVIIHNTKNNYWWLLWLVHTADATRQDSFVSSALAVWTSHYVSGDGGHLRLLLIQCWNQTSDGLLELTVLGGVDERVDTAVGEHQYHCEVVIPACKVDRVADEKSEKHQDFIWCPADDESAANHQWRDHCIAPGCVYHGIRDRTHLQEMNYYPNVTTLRSGLCYRNSVCRLSSVCLQRWCTLLRGLNRSAKFLHRCVRWPSSDLSAKFYEDSPRGTSPSGAINARGVSK